jgi:hypothetical protein
MALVAGGRKRPFAYRTEVSSGAPNGAPQPVAECQGCEFLREGSRHTVYVNRDAQRSSTVPRHTTRSPTCSQERYARTRARPRHECRGRSRLRAKLSKATTTSARHGWCRGWCTRASARLPGIFTRYDYPANPQKIREPTSGLEPLTRSSYEFACVRSMAFYHVRRIGLSMDFSAYRRQSCVRCVLACTSPVAVRVAVSPARLHTGSEKDPIRLPCSASSAPYG